MRARTLVAGTGVTISDTTGATDPSFATDSSIIPRLDSSNTWAGANQFDALVTVNAGLMFPAVQVVSGDANTLDDYEEGTWTPVIGGSGGTSGQTYGVQVGKYIKVGILVHVQGRVTLTAKGTITTSVQIQGLPFTISNDSTNDAGSPIAFFGAMGTNWSAIGGVPIINTTAATLTGQSGAVAASTVLVTADITNTTDFAFAFTYKATA